MAMAEIFLFKPQSEHDAERSVREFVEHCRTKLTVFGRELPFDEHEWDVTRYIALRGRAHRTRILFFDWETSVDAGEPTYMKEPFLGLAKAYIRYQQGAKPTSEIGARITMLRAVDKVLREASNTLPHMIDAFILNRTSQMLVEQYSDGRAYRVGQQLEMFSEFLDAHSMLTVPLRWKNPIKRPSNTDRIGADFDQRRQEKLPSAHVLEALAQAYRLASLDKDVIPTSLAAIMCASPDRISEVLTLHVNCEHVNQKVDGTKDYGLRFFPAKGAPPQIKWIIPSAVDLVQEAVAKIRERTEGPRTLAKWYEEHPDNVYLPPHLEYLRGQDLVKEDLAELIWGDRELTKSLSQWRMSNRVNSKDPRKTLVRFEDFEQAVIKGLPPGFPVLDAKTGLKYSDALCVTYIYQLHHSLNAQVCFFGGVTQEHVSNALGAADGRNTVSVFDRLELKAEDGKGIRIHTHQFRHYLNTLAMHGGLDELDVAKWSGRKDVRQNRAYDHVSASDKLALIRSSLGDDSKMFGPLGWAPNVPTITRDEFANLVVTTAHTTEFGYCIHDYVMSPCQQHTDCLNCSEMVCIKGDETRTTNIRKAKQETVMLLSMAEKQSEAGVYGANRWVAHQRQTLERLNQLCELLDNPVVQQGAVIQLKYAPTASRLAQGAEKRGIDLSNTARIDGEVPAETSRIKAS